MAEDIKESTESELRHIIRATTSTDDFRQRNTSYSSYSISSDNTTRTDLATSQSVTDLLKEAHASQQLMLLPYVILAAFISLAFLASFLHFHFTNKERYVKRREIAAKEMQKKYHVSTVTSSDVSHSRQGSRIERKRHASVKAPWSKTSQRPSHYQQVSRDEGSGAREKYTGSNMFMMMLIPRSLHATEADDSRR